MSKLISHYENFEHNFAITHLTDPKTLTSILHHDAFVVWWALATSWLFSRKMHDCALALVTSPQVGDLSSISWYLRSVNVTGDGFWGSRKPHVSLCTVCGLQFCWRCQRTNVRKHDSLKQSVYTVREGVENFSPVNHMTMMISVPNQYADTQWERWEASQFHGLGPRQLHHYLKLALLGSHGENVVNVDSLLGSIFSLFVFLYADFCEHCAS